MKKVIFNDNQLEAIKNTYNKNTLVIAGPGSGKTTTLTERAKYIINNYNVKPENMMIITFTVKSANDLKRKISKKINNYELITIGTFHSVCFKLIKQFKKELVLDNISIISDKEATDVLIRAIIKNRLYSDSKSIKKYKREISLLKSELITTTKYTKRYITDRESYELGAVFETYQDELYKSGLLDYDDIILYAVALLKCSEKAKKYCHDKFKFVMIDEVQDCNYAQFEFLKEIHNSKNNLFCVGDDFQAIYGFRGTSPEYMINFENTFDNTKIIKLSQNYRSTKIIVRACNEIANNSNSGFKKDSFTENKEGMPIVVKECKNQKEEAIYVKNMIERKVETGKFSYNDFCVLYRNNSQCELIKDIFRKHNIPYNVKGENNFYLHNEVKYNLNLIKFASNKKDRKAFIEITNMIPDMENDFINYIDENLPKTNGDYFKALENVYNMKPSKAVSKLIELINISNTIEPYYYLKETSDYIKNYINCRPWKSSELENIKDLIHMVKEYSNENNEILLGEVSDYISLNKPTPTRREVDSVSLATVHASKGLEYENVFLIGADNNTFTHNKSSESDENRRLFFVALSRAKYRIFISYSMKSNSPLQAECLKASEFLDDISDECLAYDLRYSKPY